VAIVEDEMLLAMDYEDILTSHGAAVVGTSTRGHAAIEVAREQRPDVAIMDIMLPGKLDGIDVARVVRAHLHIGVVFVSASQDEDIGARIDALHGPELLSKPVAPERLVEAVRRAAGLD
jgi:DNA-binding NarL/FixJ family response regulator